MTADSTLEELIQRIKALESKIDKNKLTEEALRKNEAQYRNLIEKSDDIIWQASLDLHTTYISPSIEKKLGFTPTERMAQDLDKQLTPASYELVTGILTQELERELEGNADPNRTIKMEVQYYHKNGSTLWFENIVSGLRDEDGALCGIHGISRDITARMRVAEALKKSEKKYKQLFKHAPVGIFEFDFLKGRFITVNEVMSAYTGYTKEELLSMNPLDLFTEKSKARYGKRAAAQLAGKKISKSVEYEIIAKGGQELCVLFNSDYSYENGKLKRSRVVIHDITERKQFEAELRQAIKMDSLGTLTGGIAHQFNNALTGITGNLELLEMDFSRDETIGTFTRSIKESTDRMTRLTAQLLAYSRGGKYQVKTMSLGNFFKKTLPLIKHSLNSAIHIDTKLPIDPLVIEADPPQMQMVLSAVLTNASEAIEAEGSIRVACGSEVVTQETAGSFPGLEPGNYATLAIADNGTGMDEEARSRIFDPFFTTKSAGRGLGMSAVYGIVKNHAGWISVDSEPDRGTTVKIYLPAVKAPAKEHAKKPETEVVKGTGTILVIEDEEPVMTVARAILNRLGYCVLEARTGREAIEVVKSFDGHIDLALLDFLLDDMSGDVVYPFLMETRPDLKVVVFSGYGQTGPVQKVLDAGAQGFIQKPFTMADLSQKLQKILGDAQ